MPTLSMTITGLMTVVLGLFIDDKAIVSALVADLVTVVGIAIAWYGRFRHGDLKLGAFKR